MFYDLGSGAGRLVAQAWLELPVARAVGVELAPSRHAAALRAWRGASTGAEVRQLRAEGGPEFRLASMLETDLADATHVYVASLVMGDELLDALWRRLEAAPALEAVATLRRFRAPKPRNPRHVHKIEGRRNSRSLL